jgi:type I restriction enzyme S subunit
MPEVGLVNQHIFRVIPDSKRVDKSYLRLVLHLALLEMQKHLHGATMQHVNRREFLGTPVFLPTLDEQRQIADILDRADALRSSRRSGIALLSQLIIAAFGARFSRAELAERVPLARAFAAPPNYGTMIPPAETGDFLSLRVKSIQNGSLDLSDAKYVDLPLKDRPRHSVQDGDLLMARAIGSLEHLGKCVVVYPGNARWAFDSHLMRIRLDRSIMLPEYLQVWLLTPGGRASFLRIARRSAVQYNVNTKEIAAFPVPIPAIAKQRAFVECLHAIEAEERLMASSLAHLDELFESLQYRAFAGEL